MKKILLPLIIFILGFTLVSAGYESFINVVGVDNQGRGIIGNVTVEIQPGKGRVLVDTTPLQGIYTQDSERIAVKVASGITGFDFSEYDVIYSIITSNAHVIDGPSAGGALALVTIAAVEEKEISRNFAMTGTIEEDGSIGGVGEILAKANVAADNGITVFLIPEGQRIQNQYVKKIKHPQPGWYIETIEPVSVDVIEYAKDKWGMNVYEVSNINEAVKYAFGEIPESNGANIEPIDNDIILIKFTSPIKDYNDFSRMVGDELKEAESRYDVVLDKLDSSGLPSEVKSVLIELMENSEDYLERGREIQDQGYAYSSANEGFKSIITTNVVEDVINYYSSEDQRKYLEDRFKEIQEEINKTKEKVILKTNKMICDPDNFEWAVASRQRITYAENRINLIKIGETDPIEIFYKINTAKEWLEISESFMKKSTYRSTNTDCLEEFKEQAENIIKETENRFILEKSMGYEDIEDIEWYLDAAKTEFEEGWYITSIYDATAAKTRIRVGSSYENKEIEEIYSDFNQKEVIPQDLIGTIFLENSYYYIYRAVKDDSKSDAALAIQLQALSEEIDNVYQDAKGKMGNPLFNWSIDWSFQMTEEDYETILIIVILALLLYVVAISTKVRKLEKRLGMRRKSKRELS